MPNSNEPVNTKFNALSKEEKAKCFLAGWSVNARKEGLLMIDPYSPTITLTVRGSGLFIVGFTNDDPYVFIGIHESMMPWFLDVPWVRVDVVPSANRIHMIANMTDDKQLTFIMHEEKGFCGWLDNIDPDSFSIPFRTVVFLENNQLAWSEHIEKRIPFKILDSATSTNGDIQDWAKPILK